mgnify:CR=1 FL=1
MDNAELIKHFRWLMAVTRENACGFTKEEENKNEKIVNILRNYKR